MKVIKGPNRGKKAVIKCLFKKFGFLYNKDYTQSFGIFLEHTSNIQIMGAELLEEDRQNKVKINIFSVPEKVKKLIGKHVKIIRGMWKGYCGVLKGADQNKAKVELLSRNKTITVEIDDIIDYNNKEISNNDFMNTPRANFGNVNKTPGYYPQSPNMFNNTTSPKWNSMTPNHWSQSPYHTMASPNNWK